MKASQTPDDPDFVPVVIGSLTFKLCYVGRSLRLAKEKHDITIDSLSNVDPNLSQDEALDQNYRILLVGLLYYQPEMTIDYIESHLKLSQLRTVLGIAAKEFGGDELHNVSVNGAAEHKDAETSGEPKAETS